MAPTVAAGMKPTAGCPRAAAITANIVRAIGFTGIAFIQLIVVNNRCDPIGESNIAQRGDAVSGPRFQILQQTIAQEQA